MSDSIFEISSDIFLLPGEHETIEKETIPIINNTEYFIGNKYLSLNLYN
jgi:hypothetical protein